MVVDAIVVGVARTVVTDATVVDGAFVAVVARTVVAVSFEGDFVPGVVEAGGEEIDE